MGRQVTGRMLGVVMLTAAMSAAGQATCTWNDGWDATPVSGDHIVIASGDLTWDASLPDAVGSWSQPATYDGTVTFDTRFPGQGDPQKLTITGTAEVLGGAWSHTRNPAGSGTASRRLRVHVEGDFTLGSAATINVDGKGFDGGHGPGAGSTVNRGGAYGGRVTQGNNRFLGSSLSDTYGSIIEPSDLGSGGSTADRDMGGGSVYLTVDQAAAVEGDILARADAVDPIRSGAGGSILLRADSVSGGGHLDASSVDSPNHTGGSGGRIAIVLTGETSESFGALTYMASGSGGGGGMRRVNAAGTVYLQTGPQEDGEGTLIIDNDDRFSNMVTVMDAGAGVDYTQFDSIVIRGQGNLGIRDQDTFSFDNLAVDGREAARITLMGIANTTFPASPFEISGYTLVSANTFTHYTGHLHLKSDGGLSHPQNDNSTVYRLLLEIDGDLTIDAGGAIDLDRRGFGATAGPYADTQGTGNYGATHGGQGAVTTGGISPRPTYGSIFAPDYPGAGGNDGTGEDDDKRGGGGAAILTVTGATTLNGEIVARASEQHFRQASAGSVFLTTGTLAGSGEISVDGGHGAGDSGRSGGGGRIAVILNAGEDFGSVTMTAYGGQSTSGGDRNAAAGTVYRETAAQAGGRGTITVDNPHDTTGSRARAMLLPATHAQDDDTTLATLRLEDRGRVRLTRDVILAGMAMDANSELDLNGFYLEVRSALVVAGVTYDDWGVYAAAELESELGITQVIDSDTAANGRLEISRGMPATITNTPPQELTDSSVTLAGTLTGAGDSDTSVRVYWGATDGGDDPGAWGDGVLLEAPGAEPGDFTHALTGLTSDRFYMYRFSASNDHSEVFADPPERFLTGAPAIELESNASEEGLTSGYFRFSRPVDATGGALTVFYTIDPASTAEVGVNYEPIEGFDSGTGTGAVTIAESAVSALLEVIPLVDPESEGATNLQLDIAGDARYLPGVEKQSATLTIEVFSLPAYPTNLWTGAAGTPYASDADNWHLGLPQSDHDILLNAFSTSDIIWNVGEDTGAGELPAAVASWTQTDLYTGTVTFRTTHTNAAVSLGNVAVMGGTWTHGTALNHAHAARSLPADWDLLKVVATAFTLGEDAVIDLDGRGFRTDGGPGAGASSFGASHGGRGSGNAFDTYGSFVEPDAPGSGGSSVFSNDSRGGGVLHLTVSGDGAVVIDGLITARMFNYREDGTSRDGAGGSVSIRAGSIAGSGSINASGSATGNQHSGGGRIALSLTDAGSDFAAIGSAGADLQLLAHGGTGRTGAGTIYLERATDAPGGGTLIVDNHDMGTEGEAANGLGRTGNSLAGADYSSLSSLVVTNGGYLDIYADDLFDFGTTAIAGGGFVHVRDATGVTLLDGGGTFHVSGAYTLHADGITNVAGNVVVSNNARLAHAFNGTSIDHTLTLHITGDLTVAADSIIDVTGRGYSQGRGPGAGNQSPARGGSYGGEGGDAVDGKTYGSILRPTDGGSGGGGTGAHGLAGGGVVNLTVDGNTVVDGAILARGATSAEDPDGHAIRLGAGGSILLRTQALTLNGQINASGSADGGTVDGGGGRIAVTVNDRSGIDESKLRSHAGDATNPRGAGGSVYIEDAADGAGGGHAIFDFGGIATDQWAHLFGTHPTESVIEDIRRADVSLRNAARLRLTHDVDVAGLVVDAGGLLDLNGRRLTLRSAVVGGVTIGAGEHSADELGLEIIDSAGGGLVILPAPGSLFILR